MDVGVIMILILDLRNSLNVGGLSAWPRLAWRKDRRGTGLMEGRLQSDLWQVSGKVETDQWPLELARPSGLAANWQRRVTHMAQ